MVSHGVEPLPEQPASGDVSGSLRIQGFMLKKHSIPVILIVWLMVLAAAGESAAADRMFIFEPGERLVYRAKWFFLPAGEAVIEMLPDASVNGQPARHFVMSTSTNSQVDFFYKIRERQDSFTDLKVTRTLQYLKKSTGDYPRDSAVLFDWTRMTATYTNFGQPEKTVNIQPGTFDPLSLIFAIRMYRLIPGDVLEIPVTDGKRVVNAKAIVASRETVKINDNVYDTLLVIPDMSRMEGIVSGRGGSSIKIWFTTDERHLPVKIQTRIAVGSFVFELVSATF
jgi:hypothetical protein